MINIVFFASNPEGTSLLNLDEEIRSIKQKIRASDHRDVLELESLWAVRPDDLLQALNEHQPQIVHFSGHGSMAGEIILMDSDRQPKPVSPEALEMLFTTLKDNIRVVLLNACYSEVQAGAIAEVIDCVIGMSTAVGDEAAITFAASFYRAIGFGRSVQDAFEQGKTAILLEGISEAGTPQLLVRPGVDPKQVFLTGEQAEDAISETDLAQAQEQMPARLRELVEAGTQFIDIPYADLPDEVEPERADDYLFCELKMRQTSAAFVFRVPKVMKIEDAAEYLVGRLLPHMRSEDYEWTIVHGDNVVPSFVTFVTSSIASGDTVYLIGDHRMPAWRPHMGVL